jgi:hypothetical protein
MLTKNTSVFPARKKQLKSQLCFYNKENCDTKKSVTRDKDRFIAIFFACVVATSDIFSKTMTSENDSEIASSKKSQVNAQ